MKNKAIIIGIIVLVILAIGGIVLADRYSSKSEVPQYSAADSERPKLELSENNFDMGKLKVSDTKTKEISIKNNGQKPLTISNFSTSCGCTLVEVIIDGQTSPKFSMHTKTNWQEELSPGQSAKLNIIYQPSLMPVEGEVSRTVYFKTNDPESMDVKINFKALVEK